MWNVGRGVASKSRLLGRQEGNVGHLSIEIRKNKLLIDGKEVRFPFAVHRAVEFEDVVVVCLDVPRRQSLPNNVFGVSKDGTVLWQIRSRSAMENSRFTGCSREGENASVFNMDGTEYLIDPKTGTVLSTKFVK